MLENLHGGYRMQELIVSLAPYSGLLSMIEAVRPAARCARGLRRACMAGGLVSLVAAETTEAGASTWPADAQMAFRCLSIANHSHLS